MDGDQAAREHLHTIGVVCRRTGLKSDRVRAWERRYGVVTPVRSDGNQRLYRDRDVEKLLLLRRATDQGHRIAQIATMTVEELDELLAIDSATRPFVPAARPSPGEVAEASTLLSACLAAVQQLDAERLDLELARASEALSAAALTQQLLVPLVETIGDLWAEGGIRAAHEHLATAVLRKFMDTFRSNGPAPPSAPRLLVTTPAGERHELGALLAVATAADSGWRVTYLGPDLPAEDIAAAARQRETRAIGLSIVCPTDEEAIAEELRKLRRHAGDDMGIVLGGRAADRFEAVASEIDAVLVADLVGLQPALALFA